MASFDPIDRPLDAQELDYISKQLYVHEFTRLRRNLRMGTRVENAAQMLSTWHSNQDPAKERRLLVEALNKSSLGNLAKRFQRGGRRALQPSSAQHPSRPRKRSRPNILQQPDIAPMQIPQQTSFEITEIKLRDVSIKLGAEWRTVGTYLGLNNSQIEVMLEDYRVVKECIFQMLLQWRNNNGAKATKDKFKKALRRSQREDLADFIDEADD